MKQLIIKITFFSMMVALSLKFFLDPIFNKTSHFKETINQYYNSNKDSIDILIFGTSHAYQTFNPKLIDKSLGTYTFNLGSGAQFISVTNYLQKEILKECKPKLIILDVYAEYIRNILTKEEKAAQLKVFDNVKFSREKATSFFEIYKKEDILSVLSQTIRRHNKWDEVLLNHKRVINSNNIRGYKENRSNITEVRKKEFYDFRNKTYQLKEVSESNLGIMNQNQKKEIIDFVISAKNKNIDVLLVSAPYLNSLYNNWRLNFDSSVKELADSLDINYLNFNTNFKGLDLMFSDFSDPNHVNTYGSKKVTATLSSYIAIKYNFQIKNQDYLNTFLGKIKLKTIINENEIVELDKKSYLKESPLNYLFKHPNQFDKILLNPFQFNEMITLEKGWYINEFKNKYIFVFKLKKVAKDKDLENFRGYIRYYNGEVKKENKHVYSFPMNLIEGKGEQYLIVRKTIKNKNISKFDIFFMKKHTSQASKFYTKKDFKLVVNQNK